MMLRIVALGLLLVLAYPALADPPLPSPAPSLGPEKYTIHTSGTLRDIIPVLTKLTHRQIWLDSGRHGPDTAPPPKPIDDTPVSLNFDNATLTDILLSLCKQAGVVYDAPQGFYGPQGPPIQLRAGDLALDGRPTCVLDDYVLRVTQVNATQNHTASFRWGTITPDRPAEQNTLQLILDIVPRTPEAELRFAGLQAHVRAVPDAGKPLDTVSGMPVDFFQPVQRDPWGQMNRQPSWLNLPLPDPAATILTRLEGKLTCFSEVKVTEITIPPGSEGKTFTQDDVKATVKTWKIEGANLRVEVVADCPPIVHDTRQSWYGRDWQKVELLTADGRQATPNATSAGNDNGKVTISYTYSLNPSVPQGEAATPLVPTGLRITFIRSGPADKVIPFVIENIPLP